jgi:two-component system invasion response regulator UvrY
MEQTRVLLADSQALAIAGLRQILSATGKFEIVAETSDANELERLLHDFSPQLLVLDYSNLKNFSVTTCLKIIRNHPFLSILVITSDSNAKSILSILQANVLGFVTKDCSRQEILNAFQAVSNGQKFYCNKVLDVLMDKQFNKTDPAFDKLLTEREVQIIGFISQGVSTQEMASRLHLSTHTVNAHRKNILKKLKVNSPVELVVKAVQAKIIQLPA